jgi:hypothetical protein
MCGAWGRAESRGRAFAGSSKVVVSTPSVRSRCSVRSLLHDRAGNNSGAGRNVRFTTVHGRRGAAVNGRAAGGTGVANCGSRGAGCTASPTVVAAKRTGRQHRYSRKNGQLLHSLFLRFRKNACLELRGAQQRPNNSTSHAAMCNFCIMFFSHTIRPARTLKKCYRCPVRNARLPKTCKATAARRQLIDRNG